MWTLLSVPREDGLLARVRNDDAATGPLPKLPTRRPRARRKAARAPLAGFPKSDFQPGSPLFFPKSCFWLLLFEVATFPNSETYLKPLVFDTFLIFWVLSGSKLLFCYFSFFFVLFFPGVVRFFCEGSFFPGVWALGGCCRLCRFQAPPHEWSSCHLSCPVWCVGAPPPRARRGPVCIWRWQEHFLHDGPSGLCRAMCRRGSGSNSHRRMVDTCFSTNQSRRCVAAIRYLHTYFFGLL